MLHPQSVISAVRIRTSSWRLAVVASACIRTAGVTACRTVTARTEWIATIALRPTRADFRTAVADIAMITAAIIKNKAAIRAPDLVPGRVGPGPQKKARRRP